MVITQMVSCYLHVSVRTLKLIILNVKLWFVSVLPQQLRTNCIIIFLCWCTNNQSNQLSKMPNCDLSKYVLINWHWTNGIMLFLFRGTNCEIANNPLETEPVNFCQLIVDCYNQNLKLSISTYLWLASYDVI